MRAAGIGLLGALTALCGCSREAEFDQRYQDVSASISASADAIDAEILATPGAEPGSTSGR